MPFDVELTEIGIFPVTNVVYVEVGEGAAELERMHRAMNTGPLGFKEPFPYHPHVTLAQEIPLRPRYGSSRTRPEAMAGIPRQPHFSRRADDICPKHARKLLD